MAKATPPCFGITIVLSLFLASSQSSLINENVPLAIITSSGVELAPVSIGTTISADLLAQTTLSAISENVEKVVVITLPKLSYSHLVYDANYNNHKNTLLLNKALVSMSSVLYPAVSDIEHVFKFFSGLRVTHLDSAVEFDTSLLNNRVTQVKLDSEATLKDADIIIGSVVKYLEERNIQFSVIFTAEQADEWIYGVPNKETTLVRSKRQAPRVEKPTYVQYGQNCFFMRTEMINVTVLNGQKTLTGNLNTDTPFNDTTACSFPKHDPKNLEDMKKPRYVWMNYTTQQGDFTSINLQLNFSGVITEGGTDTLYGLYWAINSIRIIYTGTGVQGDQTIVTGKILTAPLKFSYHCTYPERLVWYKDKKKPTTSEYVSIQFGNFQAEAFMDQDWPYFSYPCDCEGFFTPAIWAGLLVSLIYLLIIGLAMTMLVNLETMDRFEDPKGQPLRIHASG